MSLLMLCRRKILEELLTIDELRKLDVSKGIVFIRGELTIMDRKFDMFLHPNIYPAGDGGAKP